MHFLYESRKLDRFSLYKSAVLLVSEHLNSGDVDFHLNIKVVSIIIYLNSDTAVRPTTISMLILVQSKRKCYGGYYGFVSKMLKKG